VFRCGHSENYYPSLTPAVHLRFLLLQRFTGLAAVFSLSALTGCQPEPPQVVRPTPLPQDQYIQVFMNHDAALTYEEPYRHYVRDGANLEQVIIDTIATADSTIEIAVQELRLPGIAQALVERQQAGVKVRVILENTYSRPYSDFTDSEVANLPTRERDRYQEARRLIDLNGDGHLSPDEVVQRDALVILDQAQVQRIDDTADGSAGSDLMHHKFLVVDGKTVVVSSANLTPSDVHGDFKSQHSRGNANNLLKITSPELATVFTQEFNYMWGDGPGGQINSLFGVKKPFRPAQRVQVGDTQVQVQFSPTSRTIPWVQSTNGLISKTLTGASKSIQMALFVFSDQELVNQLEPLQQRAVEIRTLIDPGFAYRSYSEALDMMGVVLLDDCRSEQQNRPWKNAISTVGVPRLPPGDLLHHKFGLVDQHTVITGSQNWTEAANNGNDETVLVIPNPIVAAHYSREFERLYTHAILGVPPAIRKKAEAQMRQCQPTTLSTSTHSSQNGLQEAKTQAVTPPNRPKLSHPAAQSLNRIKSVSRSTLPTKQRVNLNTASQTELEQLSGVGPKLAKRIIAARQKRPFKSLADLDEVSGIGPKLIQKLQDQVEW